MIKHMISLLSTTALLMSAEATHYTFKTRTDAVVPVYILKTVTPTIDGISLEAGDEIGVFTNTGICAGAIKWEDGESDIYIGAWSDIQSTDAIIEGLRDGDTIQFKFYDASADEEVFAKGRINGAPVVYNKYDTEYILTALEAFSPIAITDEPVDLALLRGETATFTVVATGGDSPVYQWKKDGVAIDGATSATFTIAAVKMNDAGEYSCSITDGTTSAVSSTATLAVSNQKPTMSAATAQTIDEDGSLDITLDMVDDADGDGDELTFVLADGTNYTVSGTTITPAKDFHGALTVPVKVTDGIDESESVTMTITVNAVNDAPTLSDVTAQNIEENGSVVLSLDMTDAADIDNVLTDASLVIGAGENYTVNGTTITPASNWFGTLSVPVSVTDGELTSPGVMLTILVNSFNDAPTLSEATQQTIAEDGSLTVLLSMTDATDIDNALTDASVIISSGDNYTVNGTTVIPTANWFGTLSVPVSVTDGENTTAPVMLSIVVTAENDSPIATGTIENKETTVNDEFTLTIDPALFSDVDEENLVITVTGLPEGLTFDGTTISGTPVEEGVSTVIVTATDASDATAEISFTITAEFTVDLLERKGEMIGGSLMITPNPAVLTVDNAVIHFPDMNGEGEISIFDVQGNLLNRQRIAIDPTGSYSWDLRNQNGDLVGSGSYLVILRATDRSGGSRLYKSLLGVQK